MKPEDQTELPASPDVFCEQQKLLQRRLADFLLRALPSSVAKSETVTLSLCKTLELALKDCKSQKWCSPLSGAAFGVLVSYQGVVAQLLMETVAAFFCKLTLTDWQPELCHMLSSACEALLRSEPAGWQTPVLQQLLGCMQLPHFILRDGLCKDVLEMLSCSPGMASGAAVVHQVA